MRPESQPVEETFGSPSGQDWALFQNWARCEGWRVPERELSLYRNELAKSAFVLREGQGGVVGFVTVCRQQGDGWIGNLIVDPARRGAGFGRRLFQHAAATLSAHGVTTLWLTASADGRPLYENCGFIEAGRIERWVWQDHGPSEPGTVATGNGELYTLVRADAAAWGHSRAGLLTLLARDGRIFRSGSTVAMLQPGAGLSVLGPWLSADHCPRANRLVLSGIVEAGRGRGEIAVDVMGGSPVRVLLRAAGFCQTGETVLMMRGAAGKVRLSEVMALASLGSMG